MCVFLAIILWFPAPLGAGADRSTVTRELMLRTNVTFIPDNELYKTCPVPVDGSERMSRVIRGQLAISGNWPSGERTCRGLYGAVCHAAMPGSRS